MALLAHIFTASLSSQLCTLIWGLLKLLSFPCSNICNLNLLVVSEGAEVSAFLLIFAPLTFHKYMLLLTKSIKWHIDGLFTCKVQLFFHLSPFSKPDFQHSGNHQLQNLSHLIFQTQSTWHKEPL